MTRTQRLERWPPTFGEVKRSRLESSPGRYPLPVIYFQVSRNKFWQNGCCNGFVIDIPRILVFCDSILTKGFELAIQSISPSPKPMEEWRFWSPENMGCCHKPLKMKEGNVGSQGSGIPIGNIYHLYATYSHWILGGLYATDPTFYGNLKQPLIYLIKIPTSLAWHKIWFRFLETWTARGVSRRNPPGRSVDDLIGFLRPENGTFFWWVSKFEDPKSLSTLIWGVVSNICFMLLIPRKTHVSDGLKPPTSSSCVCFSWWFFTDSTMVNHKIKPPFGRIFFGTFFQASQASKSKVHFDPEKKTQLWQVHMGVSLNGGTSKTPQNGHFS